jgi:hypothetical protein
VTACKSRTLSNSRYHRAATLDDMLTRPNNGACRLLHAIIRDGRKHVAFTGTGKPCAQLTLPVAAVEQVDTAP